MFLVVCLMTCRMMLFLALIGCNSMILASTGVHTLCILHCLTCLCIACPLPALQTSMSAARHPCCKLFVTVQLHGSVSLIPQWHSFSLARGTPRSRPESSRARNQPHRRNGTGSAPSSHVCSKSQAHPQSAKSTTPSTSNPGQSPRLTVPTG